jgi:hypothetical protein
MIATAKLEVDVARVERTSTGLVDAGVRVRVAEITFPHEDWTDFAVLVVAWWAEALVRILNGDSMKEEIRFMDGPYVVRVERTTNDAWRLELVDDFQVRRVRHAAVVDPVPLVASVVAAADSLLELCRTRGWESRDSVRLATLASGLRDRGAR